MHFLVIPYAVLGIAFTAGYLGRSSARSAGAFALFCLAAFFIYLWAVMAFRVPSGDSFRYYQRFLFIRTLSLQDSLGFFLFDPLFTVLLWLVGLLGADEWLMFGAALVIYLGVLSFALFRLFNPLSAGLVLLAYAGFPYFIAYGVNALRQGLALAFVIMAVVEFYRGSRSGWAWLLIAPLWHNGAWMAVGVVALHQLLVRYVASDRMKWTVIGVAYVASQLLSITSLNAAILQSLPDVFEISSSQYIYFSSADRFEYQVGFRADFSAFSLIPLLTALLLRGRSPVFDYRSVGWWLSLYLALNVIYNVFSFAPFADRFASFSWILMPLVVMAQLFATRSWKLQNGAVVVVSLANVAAVQLYTGGFLMEPTWM